MSICLPSAVRAAARTSRILGILLPLLVCLWPMVGPAETTPQLPLDAVVLMDDSGSMRWTDPLKLRISAFSLFIRLLRNDDAVGLVKFDDGASVVAPLEVLIGDSQRTHLDKAVSRLPARGAYTDIYTGLKVALEAMQQRSRETAEKVVLLLSDGIMDVNPAAGMSHEEKLRLLHDTVLPAYRAARVRIVTLALSPEADRALLEDIAMATQGHFFYAPQAPALSPALYSIFNDLKQPEMIPVIGQRLTIDSSVQEATFFIITDGTREEIALVKPDGVKIDRTHRDAAVKWYVGKNYVLVTIRNPLAGEWQVDMPQQRPIKVAIITDVRLKVALDQDSYVAEQAAHIAAQLAAEGASSQEPLPLEELIFIAEVIPPNAAEGRRLALIPQGESTSTSADHHPASPALGQWHNTIYTPLSTTGEYRGRVIATAPTFGREKSFVFRVLPSPGTSAREDHSVVLPTPSETAKISDREPTVASALLPSLPLPSDEAVGDMALEDQEVGEEDLMSWAPWMRALRRWAIGHGILFALVGVVLLGLRLKTGVWWKLPAQMMWHR